MGSVRFQDQLGDSLRAYAPFVYKPPDGIAANWRPADWLICLRGRMVAVEAKQCRSNAWAWADWTPQQRAAAELLERSGGLYWLVINWRGPVGTKSLDTFTYALPGFVARHYLEAGAGGRKSLTPSMTRDLPGIDVKWVPGQQWNVDFLNIGI